MADSFVDAQAMSVSVLNATSGDGGGQRWPESAASAECISPYSSSLMVVVVVALLVLTL